MICHAKIFHFQGLHTLMSSLLRLKKDKQNNSYGSLEDRIWMISITTCTTLTSLKWNGTRSSMIIKDRWLSQHQGQVTLWFSSLNKGSKAACISLAGETSITSLMISSFLTFQQEVGPSPRLLDKNYLPRELGILQLRLMISISAL